MKTFKCGLEVVAICQRFGKDAMLFCSFLELCPLCRFEECSLLKYAQPDALRRRNCLGGG